MRLRYYAFVAALLLFLSSLLCSCEVFQRPNLSKAYMLPRPQKTFLDKKMAEVSGLFYLPKENYFLSICDDKKKVYRLNTLGEESDYFAQDLGASGDYEDVIKVKGTVYVLRSDGHLVEAVQSPGTDTLQVTDYPFLNNETNDFETLYYDSTVNGLVVLCKSCAHEKGQRMRTAFKFDLATKTWSPRPFYTISTKSVADALKDGKVEFKPSAAAIHPLEKRLYILSSAGHLLIVANLRGQVASVYRLNPNLYPQAEGIAFATNGDMYITNEAKLGKPSLLRLPYKPAVTQKR